MKNIVQLPSVGLTQRGKEGKRDRINWKAFSVLQQRKIPSNRFGRYFIRENYIALFSIFSAEIKVAFIECVQSSI